MRFTRFRVNRSKFPGKPASRKEEAAHDCGEKERPLTIEQMRPDRRGRCPPGIRHPKMSRKGEFECHFEIGRAHRPHDPFRIRAGEFSDHSSHRFGREYKY